MAGGAKIIEGLKQAIAGDLSRVTIDGQTWVRADAPKPVSIIGPNTCGGMQARGDYGELSVPVSDGFKTIEPPLTTDAATMRLWFRTWADAQAFAKSL